MIALYLVAVLMLSAVSSAALMSWVLQSPAAWAVSLRETELHKVFNRVSLFWLLIFLPLVLRECGWRGWGDLGFFPEDGESAWQPWSRALAGGVLVGFVSLGAIQLLCLLVGHRWYSPEPGVSLFWKTLGFAGSALLVGLLEETISRGILFRSLARVWSVWPAALATSLLFAAGHFFGPARGFSFQAEGLAARSFELLGAAFHGTFQEPHVLLRITNLTLMSVALCLLVWRTGTTWYAIGLHAAWVWLIRVNQLFTNGPSWANWSLWLGKKSDATDSLLATAMLIGLMVYAVRSSRFNRGGRSGRVAPLHPFDRYKVY